MLMQFAVENFLSFRDKAVLSMVPADGVEHEPRQIVSIERGPKLLKCAAVYGANASGKSNLVKALGFAQRLILFGARGNEPQAPMLVGTRQKEPLGVAPFKLDPKALSEPSRFEFELFAGGRQYSYGFVVTNQAVRDEWLYESRDGQERRVFERSFVEGDPSTPKIILDESFVTDSRRLQFLQFVAEGTRSNQLFLTEAHERNVSELAHVVESFVTWAILQPETEYPSLAFRLLNEPHFLEEVKRLVSALDVGIHDLTVERSSAREHLPDLDPTRIAFRGGANIVRDPATGELERLDIKPVHKRRDGESVPFDLSEESDGTRRLLHVVPAILHSKEKGWICTIDELDRSLHPLLTRAFVRSFLEEIQGSQLIFTTHDTNLLDLSLLSRDSIWFVQKDAHGASALYSLAEYKREQLAELLASPQTVEDGYLDGRFGAIPFFGDPGKLGWTSGAK